MDALLTFLSAQLSRFDLRAVVDIAIVTTVMYWVLTLISGTTAATLVRGIIILLTLGFVLSNLFNLTVLSWLLRNAIPALLVAIPILFAPELRRALEQLGRAGSRLPRAQTPLAGTRAADAIASAAVRLAERRWGALVVIEHSTALGEYVESGIKIDGLVSVDLLLNIFYPNSPLHDGAVIVRGDRVVAAGVVLPLTQAGQDSHMGTRHRAAVGISERSDAMAVVVSEETGTISIANNGQLKRGLGESQLRTVLSIHERPGGSNLPGWLNPFDFRDTPPSTGSSAQEQERLARV